MIKLSPQRAALVLAGSAIALSAAMLPAQAATNGWRIDSELAVRGATSGFFSIDAVSARDAWAAGVTLNDKNGTFQPVLKYWAGKNWQPVALPAAIASRWQNSFPIFTQVAASSATNAWVFSSYPGGHYLHLNGKQWSLGSLPASSSAGTSIEITAVADLGDDSAWAFGAELDLAGSTQAAIPYAAHFDGSKWTGQTLPGQGAITAVSVASSGTVWAVVGRPNAAVGPVSVQGTTRPLVLQWTTTDGWQRAAVQPALPTGANLTSVQAAPGGAVWIGGSVPDTDKGKTPFAAQWTAPAPAWTPTNLGGPSAGKWELTDMAPDGSGGLWGVTVAGNVKGEPERLWHLTGSTWSQATPSFGKDEWILVQLAAVPGTPSVWGAGNLRSGTTRDGLIAIGGPTP
ncbi:MAG: hypothetical protein ACLQFR_04100 [Streptosporangiaceae bacterium]